MDVVAMLSMILSADLTQLNFRPQAFQVDNVNYRDCCQTQKALRDIAKGIL